MGGAPNDHVALIVGGRVLADASGRLPALPPLAPHAHRTERPLTEVLSLVDGELLLAPTAELADGSLLHFVGLRGPSGDSGSASEHRSAPGDLAEPEHAAAVGRTIAELAPGDAPALRPAWFAPGWFDLVEAWIDAVLAPLGRRRIAPVEPHQLRSISAVLRVPTDAGVLWCKAPFRHFRDEARIHREVARLLPALVPALVAVEVSEGWLLMEPMAGAEEETQAEGIATEAASQWAAAQLATVEHVPSLLAAGLEHRGLEATIGDFELLLSSSSELALLTADELTAARTAAVRALTLTRELWSAGIPEALCHGDLHLGNVAWDGDSLRVFDWTDGCISHPFLDGAHLVRALDGEDAAIARDAYASVWRAAHPAVVVGRMLEIAPLVDLVFQTVTFERIARATEAQSAWELGGIVARNLRQLPQAVAAVSGG
ncbi:aminoglycoside phosphotransferase family protein [Agrococcus sp. Marseille-P2731]|uniref:aminoglycoside phosphotransferase family protein n=1 Tax=Agrococcus sp. Marseille-P2731 TaxID=1841862 RepID=UPI00093032C6|nr:aminoglycoside phosphotransferase family protein [Agrococcus sp. Marseille-P2731]